VQEAETLIDEPLAVLAGLYHMESTAWTLHEGFVEDLCHSNPQARGGSFQISIAFALAMTFQEPKCLSDVFDFAEPCELMNQKARLVAIDGDVICYPVSPREGPAAILGRHCKTFEDTLQWFQNPQGVALCFPSDKVGPDCIMLFLLPDHSIIRVFIQFKNHDKLVLSPADTAKAFRTTDPLGLCSEKVTQPQRESKEKDRSQEEFFDEYALAFCALSTPHIPITVC